MLSLIATLASLASAAPPAPVPNEPVQVVVLAILASEKSDKVHEKLAEIAAEVRKKDPALTGFDLHKTFNRNLQIGETATFDLGIKAKVELVINEKTDDAGRMTMTVKPPKLDEITYACTCGKFFPIVTNHFTAENERLIVAVMAKPCKRKQ